MKNTVLLENTVGRRRLVGSSQLRTAVFVLYPGDEKESFEVPLELFSVMTLTDVDINNDVYAFEREFNISLHFHLFSGLTRIVPTQTVCAQREWEKERNGVILGRAVRTLPQCLNDYFP